MRRWLASLLIVLWIAGLSLPVLQAQASVPACCRRDGKHHCAVHSEAAGFHSTDTRCPYHYLTPLTSRQISALPAAGHAVVASGLVCARIGAALLTPVLYASYTVPKRGPPQA